jgi:hypothetical protein
VALGFSRSAAARVRARGKKGGRQGQLRAEAEVSACGPGERRLPGISGRRCAPGNNGEGEEKALTAGDQRSERERRERARGEKNGPAVAHAAKGERGVGDGPRGRLGPGRKREKRKPERERERGDGLG